MKYGINLRLFKKYFVHILNVFKINDKVQIYFLFNKAKFVKKVLKFSVPNTGYSSLMATQPPNTYK